MMTRVIGRAHGGKTTMIVQYGDKVVTVSGRREIEELHRDILDDGTGITGDKRVFLSGVLKG